MARLEPLMTVKEVSEYFKKGESTIVIKRKRSKLEV